MDFSSTIDIIIKDLNDACRIIDDLKSYPGVPALQVELAKAKCRSAGEVIAMLKTMSEPLSEIKTSTLIIPPVKEIISVETKPEEQPVVYQQPIEPEEKKEPARAARSKQKSEEKEKKEQKTEPAAPQTDKPTVSEKIEKIKPGTSIIADKFSNLPTSIHEKFETLKSDDDVKEILKSKPIKSLSEAIGINDRFLFIKEIFEGNKTAYDQAILRLESSGSISDAKAVIFSHTGSNTENEAVKQLLDLVKRKLTPNE